MTFNADEKPFGSCDICTIYKEREKNYLFQRKAQ